MSNFDFKDTAEKYKKEMMRLYGAKSTAQSAEVIPTVSSQAMPPQSEPSQPEMPQVQPPQPEPPRPGMPQVQPPQPEPPRPGMPQVQPPQSEPPRPEMPQVQPPQPEPPRPGMPQVRPPQPKPPENIDIDEKYPPPILPDFIISGNNENTSFGYLKVSVKTANGGLPLEGSLVTVSEVKNGKENIIKLMTTDSSGSTEILRLPAPLQTSDNTPQDYENFSKYNISAYSKGYFRETSVDAPVFSNITSVQTFYLIPEPFDYNSGERTIIDRNPEPVI